MRLLWLLFLWGIMLLWLGVGVGSAPLMFLGGVLIMPLTFRVILGEDSNEAQ